MFFQGGEREEARTAGSFGLLLLPSTRVSVVVCFWFSIVGVGGFFVLFCYLFGWVFFDRISIPAYITTTRYSGHNLNLHSEVSFLLSLSENLASRKIMSALSQLCSELIS